MLKWIISTVILTLLILPANQAQSVLQKEWLRKFAAEQDEYFKKNYSEAETIAKSMNMPTVYTNSFGSIMVLAGHDNGRLIYDATENLNAARSVSTDKVWSQGGIGIYFLSGAGQTLGLWEAGGIPRTTHQEFAGRISIIDGTVTTSEHATHVAGTMIASGVSPTAKGMSYAGSINGYNSTNDLSEVSTAAAGGIKVSSHSYGSIVGWRLDYRNDGLWAWLGDPSISETEDWKFGFYNSVSASWDNMIRNAENLVVAKSAGNDRGDGPSSGTSHWVLVGGVWQLSTTPRLIDGGPNGYDCINDPRGIAKNTLTVGAVNDLIYGYTGPSSVSMSSFSNWGPTDDGRIKPDLVANGISLNSSTNSSNTAYASLSGTSMSTPNVSGSIGLILEHQQNLHGSANPLKGYQLKSLLLHTCDEAGQNPGPDYVFGWGLLNTFSAVQLISFNAHLGNNQLIKDVVVQQGTTYEYQVVSDGKQPLKATISWFDLPGTPTVASLDPTNLMLVNDLDLTIIGPNQVTHFPWVLDPTNPSAAATRGENIRDNTEQVLIQNPIAGTYTIKVHFKPNSNQEQKFGLIVSGIALPQPSTTNLLNPANGITGFLPPLRLEWSVSELSHSYELQVAYDSLFTDTYLNVDSLESAAYTFTQLPSSRKLYWRVRGRNFSSLGEWSNVFNFSTSISIPPAPQTVSPGLAELIPPDNIHLIWNRAEFASNYILQVAVNAIYTNLALTDSSIIDTTYFIDSLGEGRRYYWRVSGQNESGSGATSAPRNFITKIYTPDSLSGSVIDGKAVFNWKDNSTIETKYMILKKTGSEGFVVYDSVNSNVITYTDQNYNPAVLSEYAIFAKNAISQSDTSESIKFLGTTSVEDKVIPTEFVLNQNYPNPFNPSTIIEFAIPIDVDGEIAILKIFDILGNEISTLAEEGKSAGNYKISFDAKNLSSGIYFYKLSVGRYSSIKKMILVR
ncbi:MAG TPA: S8 family serine peptidase [Ignavibacteriaceae bacterium]|nr:S8 family serine peptidase [Ignavibacteriaceae bacterium]